MVLSIADLGAIEVGAPAAVVQPLTDKSGAAIKVAAASSEAAAAVNNNNNHNVVISSSSPSVSSTERGRVVATRVLDENGRVIFEEAGNSLRDAHGVAIGGRGATTTIVSTPLSPRNVQQQSSSPSSSSSLLLRKSTSNADAVENQLSLHPLQISTSSLASYSTRPAASPHRIKSDRLNNNNSHRGIIADLSSPVVIAGNLEQEKKRTVVLSDTRYAPATTLFAPLSSSSSPGKVRPASPPQQNKTSPRNNNNNNKPSHIVAIPPIQTQQQQQQVQFPSSPLSPTMRALAAKAGPESATYPLGSRINYVNNNNANNNNIYHDVAHPAAVSVPSAGAAAVYHQVNNNNTARAQSPPKKTTPTVIEGEFPSSILKDGRLDVSLLGKHIPHLSQPGKIVFERIVSERVVPFSSSTSKVLGDGVFLSPLPPGVKVVSERIIQDHSSSPSSSSSSGGGGGVVRSGSAPAVSSSYLPFLDVSKDAVIISSSSTSSTSSSGSPKLSSSVTPSIIHTANVGREFLFVDDSITSRLVGSNNNNNNNIAAAAADSIAKLSSSPRVDAIFTPLCLLLLCIWGYMRLSQLHGRKLEPFHLLRERASMLMQWACAAVSFAVAVYGVGYALLPTSGFQGYHKIRYGVHVLNWAIVLIILVFENKTHSDRGWQVKMWWLLQGGLAFVHLYWDICLGISDTCSPPPHFWQNKVGVVSCIFSIFLALSALFQAPPVRHKLAKKGEFVTLEEEGGEGEELVEDAAETVSVGVVSKGGGGEEAASWGSKLIYSWLTPLLKKGMENPLQQEDLFEMSVEDHASQVSRVIEVAWENEKKLKGENAGIFSALWKSFGRYFIVTGCFKIINDIAVFIGPVLIRLLVEYIQDPDPSIDPQTPYFYAAGLFLAATTQSLAVGLYFHRGYKMGAQVRTAIQTVIYRKAFLLDPTARQKTSVGAAVNLMSNDASRLAEAIPYLHMMWSSPLQLFISIYLLYGVVSYSVFVGMSAMVLMMPLNAKVSQKQMELNRKIMALNDKRGKVLNEAMQGIRIIKYFAWEKDFEKKAQVVRKEQFALMWLNIRWAMASIFLWACSPLVVALVTFDSFVLTGGELNAGNAFAALALFNVMRFPLNSLPMIINFLLEGKVSCNRITKYLMLGELDPEYHTPFKGQERASSFAFAAMSSSSKKVPKSAGVDADEFELVPREKEVNEHKDLALLIEKGTFWWMKVASDNTVEQRPSLLQALGIKKKPPPPAPKPDAAAAKSVPFYLRSVNLVAEKGELVCVTGPTGCGKSTLLAAILGQLTKDEGRVSIAGRVAYVPQQAWVQNATVKENILFGKPYDEDKYQRVLYCCALEKDLQVLPDGDKTEIGENGINLSGGQKARVCLARACYADADVYLLDDPLSAVDVHVSRHLFDNCIMGLLRDKTRVLVTHHTHYFPSADRVVVMTKNDAAHEGRIGKMGSYADCMEALKHVKDDSDDDDSQATTETANSETAKPAAAAPGAAAAAGGGGGAKPGAGADAGKGKGGNKPGAGKLVVKENKEEGVVKLQVWMTFARAMGVWMTLASIIGYIISSGVELSSRVWLSLWSVDSMGESQMFYLGVYSALGVASAVAVLIRAYMSAVALMRAAQHMHDSMLIRVLRAPTKFFDTTPTGRILNRFVQDQNVLDNMLRQSIGMLMMTIMAVLSTAIVVCYVSPMILVGLVPLGAIYFYTQKFFRASSRELQRLDSVSRSPIFAHFSETLNGVATITAFGRRNGFVKRNEELISINTNAYMINNASNRWLGIRLEVIGNCVVLMAAFLALYQRNVGAGFVGLSLTSALEVTTMLNWLIRTFTQTEGYMVSVERIHEYSHIEVEAPAIMPDHRPAKDWPQDGRVEFRDVVMKYREGLEPALNGVNFVALPGQKIGIVGRTGAGKSSLAVALFRLVELQSGTIVIDSYDTAKIGLDDLRSKLAIIPQDPVLFTGTVRSNLDPFDSYVDDDLWQVLDRIHLKEKFQEHGLQAEITENGSNLSVGQRQLLCMGRALLRRARVLVMDEATASVDLELDSLIQQTIATEFKTSTVLTIAHRLATVMACDRVLVMGAGEVLEFGVPSELAATPGTHFAAMVSSHSDAKEMLQ